MNNLIPVFNLSVKFCLDQYIKNGFEVRALEKLRLRE